MKELNPNHAPVYVAALYPDLAKVFQKHGYALAVHGSVARDFDLIAVPWIDEVSTREEVLAEVNKTFAVKMIGEPQEKNHGRVAYTISVGFGECALDLSFFPNT